MSRTNTSPDQIGEDWFDIEPSVGSAGCWYELWPRLRTFPYWFCRSEPTQAAWVGCQPWFYLRLKGLWLSWVVRGGIRWPMRLGRKSQPNPPRDTRPRTRALRELTNRSIVPNRSQCLCAQAACGFSCFGSKRSPFFQTIKLMAAILRARVSRAISGFIPFPSRVS